MGLLALFALAEAASPASLPRLGAPIGNNQQWVRDSDFSSSNGGGSVLFKAIFTPEGMPEKCEIVASSGKPALRELVCRLVLERFRFESSLNEEGNAAYRVIEFAVNFGDPSSYAPVQKTPRWFTLEVDKLPPRRPEGSAVSVVISVDEAGALKGCAAIETAKLERDLVEKSCQTVSSNWKNKTEFDKWGKAIRYVRPVSLELKRRK